MDVEDVKKMVKVEDILYVAVFVTIASLGTAYFLAEQAEVRGITDLPTEYNSTFDKTANVSAAAEQVRSSISNSPLSLSTAVSLFSAGYQIMRLSLNLIFLPVDLTYSIMDELQMPGWAYVLLTALWVIAIAYAIILIIFGRVPL